MAADQYRIVVGFDGSEGAKKALAWAAEEARLRGGRLEVVRAWTVGEFGSSEEMAVIAAKALEEDTHAVLGDHPDLEVTLSAHKGHAAKVLLDHAHDADMLVVGSRGHGGFTGMLVGSVGLQVSSHAGAPAVVIVRD